MSDPVEDAEQIIRECQSNILGQAVAEIVTNLFQGLLPKQQGDDE